MCYISKISNSFIQYTLYNIKKYISEIRITLKLIIKKDNKHKKYV